MISTSLSKNFILAFFAVVFSLGVHGISHWFFSGLFGLSIFTSYQWLQERRNHWIYLLLAGFISIGYFSKIPFFSLLGASYFSLGLLVLTYEKVIYWRRNPFLKPILIALCWFVLGILIPKVALCEAITAYSFSHFLLFFALALVADLADMQRDQGHIKTIPLYLSKSVTELLVIALISCYLLMSPIIDIFSVYIGVKSLSLVLCIAPFIYFFYFEKSKKIEHLFVDALLFTVGILHLVTQIG